MNKKVLPVFNSSGQLDNNWNEHPLLDWLSNNKQAIVWGIIGLLAALILAYRFVAYKTQNAEADFLHAQNYFTQFQQNPNAHDALTKLEVIENNHPELFAKYDGPLAQTLLIQGQAPEAQKLAERIFKRTKNDSVDLYRDYSLASLAIGEQHYSNALDLSRSLQSQLEADPDLTSAHSSLVFFNTVRLALLYQQAGLSQEETSMWQKAQNQIGQLDTALANSLTNGQASLAQYAAERIRLIGQSK